MHRSLQVIYYEVVHSSCGQIPKDSNVYRYQDLVTTKKKVVATWSYNLGETLLDIQTARYGQQETYLITLSEHNVTCFNANGLFKFASRLQYTPICFHTYVNGE